MDITKSVIQDNKGKIAGGVAAGAGLAGFHRLAGARSGNRLTDLNPKYYRRNLKREVFDLDGNSPGAWGVDDPRGGAWVNDPAELKHKYGVYSYGSTARDRARNSTLGQINNYIAEDTKIGGKLKSFGDKMGIRRTALPAEIREMITDLGNPSPVSAPSAMRHKTSRVLRNAAKFIMFRR